MKTIMLLFLTALLGNEVYAQQKANPFNDIDATWQNGSDR